MAKEIKWKYDIGQILVDYNEDGSIKRDLTVIDRKVIEKTEINHKNNNKFIANKKYYKYKCNKCGFDCGEHYSTRNKKYKNEHWILECDLFGKIGCSCCCPNPQAVVKGINDITTTDEWLIPIINDDEFCKTHTHSCGNKIYPICPHCEEKQSKLISIDKIYSNKTVSCEFCSDGIKYPNKFMANVLKQLNINFEREYSPDWIKPKAYDFYIPSKNVIIEMDGGLGHGKEIHKLSKQTKKETISIDNYKDEQAKLHKIEIIRIDCDYGNALDKRFKLIKDNVLNKLNNIFNLNDIDWIECDEYGCSSLIKIACDIKNKNPNITTKEVCKILNIKSQTTISSWWKIGNGNKWCKYDIEEEMKNISSKNGMNNGLTIYVYKNNIKLGKFYSIAELERRSIELYGEKLIARYVSEALKNNKPYKGYVFGANANR